MWNITNYEKIIKAKLKNPHARVIVVTGTEQTELDKNAE